MTADLLIGLQFGENGLRLLKRARRIVSGSHQDTSHITTAQLPFARPYIARQEVATARLRQLPPLSTVHCSSRKCP
jgi:hypothetical protein